MIGLTWNVRGKRVRKYMCGGYNQYGKGFCQPSYVDEATVLDHVVPELQKALLGPEFLAELRAEARRQEEADRNPGTEKTLRRRIDKLTRDINQGNQNLALLPADRLPGVIAQVRAWEIEKSAAEEELDRVTNASAVADTDAAIARLERQLWNLRDCLDRGKPEDVRGVLRELLTKIEVWVEAMPRGTRRQHRLARGVVHVRCDEITTDSYKTSRGTTRSIRGRNFRRA